MSEVVLFIIVGGIAVAAAVAMLLSENPVHSALFLIVNFACVAFFYVMLDAPFLAMIQIAVYAGAIMVLFLFVIMLLGAERLTDPVRRFSWLIPAAVGLAAAFLAIVGISILQGNLDLDTVNDRAPMLRVINAAPYAGSVDVYANNELLASDVVFGGSTDLTTLAPGDYTVALTAVGSTTALATTDVKLEASGEREANTYSVVAYGGSATTPPQFSSLLADNLETVDTRMARVAVFNAYTAPVGLTDFGSIEDKADDKVLLTDLQPGAMVELPLVPETQLLRSWAFTDAGQVLVRLDNPDVFAVKRNTSQLLVVSQEQTSAAGLRPITIPVVDTAVPSFGGPQAIGKLLFSRYMLPFQLIAILLLAAMIGAIVLTHKENFVPRRRDVRRRVMKPLTDVISGQIGHDVVGQYEGESQPQLPEQQPEAAGD